MKTFLIISILLSASIAHAQIVIGGYNITGVKNVWDKDSTSSNMIPTMALIAKRDSTIRAQAAKDSTTLYKDNVTIIGKALVSDPLRVNLNAVIQRSTLAQVRAVKPPVGVLVYLTDSKLMIFFDGTNLQYIQTRPFR